VTGAALRGDFDPAQKARLGSSRRVRTRRAAPPHLTRLLLAVKLHLILG